MLCFSVKRFSYCIECRDAVTILSGVLTKVKSFDLLHVSKSGTKIPVSSCFSFSPAKQLFSSSSESLPRYCTSGERQWGK